jgi:hypothetical protein
VLPLTGGERRARAGLQKLSKLAVGRKANTTSCVQSSNEQLAKLCASFFSQHGVASDPLCGRAALLRIHGIFTVARERLAELDDRFHESCQLS